MKTHKHYDVTETQLHKHTDTHTHTHNLDNFHCHQLIQLLNTLLNHKTL